VIAGKTWREIRGMGFAYALILELMLIPAVLLWPNLRRGGSAIVSMMPAEFLKKMASEVMGPNDATAYRAYMAVQMFFKGVNIMAIAAAVLLGTGMIARERENQTLEFLLARPVSRSRILWGKFSVTALVVVIPIFLTSWTALPLSRVPSVDQSLPFWPVTLCCVHASAFALAMLALTTLVSVLARAQVVTAFWIGAFVVMQVAIYFVQEIRVVSLFRLSDFEIYGPIMAENVDAAGFLLGTTSWLVVAAAAAYLAADRAFRRIGL
jgi:ABC-type transport system involved in multi-copper enzyme maturation permease subunit